VLCFWFIIVVTKAASKDSFYCAIVVILLIKGWLQRPPLSVSLAVILHYSAESFGMLIVYGSVAREYRGNMQLGTW
jgi:hypothetical protein